MPHLSPPTLSERETKAILLAKAGHLRDDLIYSLTLGTGLRFAEIVGLNVGDLVPGEVLIQAWITQGRPGVTCTPRPSPRGTLPGLGQEMNCG